MYKSHIYIKFIPENHYILFDAIGNGTVFLISFSDYLLLFSHSVVSNSFATSWTVARQAPMSMGFSRQDYWNGLPFPPPGDLPDPGIEPMSPNPLH